MALRARLIPVPQPVAQDWPHHKAKWKSMPAHLLWRGERRMEGESYLTEGYQVRLAIESRAVGWMRLGQLASVTQPNRLKGILVPEGEGTPFLAATQVFGIRPIPRKWLAIERTPDSAGRFGIEGQILVTRSGTVGRAIQTPAALSGTLLSDDLLRVNPNNLGFSGWIYAFLHSPQAQAMMTSSHYGQMIKHLEPSHLEAIPVPVVSSAIAMKFQKYSEKVLALRNLSYAKTLEAEAMYEKSIGAFIPADSGEEGFSIKASTIGFGRRRIEGTFSNPVVSQLSKHLRKSAGKLQAITDSGFRAWLPSRFKRVPAEEGIDFLDSSDLFQWNPAVVKRIAEANFGDEENGRVKRGWLLLARSGQAYGINGTPVIADKSLEGKIISDHIIRIAPGDGGGDMRVGYLHTSLSHPTLGRPLVKALVYGSSIPEIDISDLLALEVPRLKPSVEKRIADLAEEAAEARGKADELERRMAAEAGAHLARFMGGDVADFVVTMPPNVTENTEHARPFGEHDCVRLAVARKDAGLRKGALGAIVHVYPGGVAFEVEFPKAKDGHEVLTLETKDLLPNEK